jgi:hypothetical protein
MPHPTLAPRPASPGTALILRPDTLPAPPEDVLEAEIVEDTELASCRNGRRVTRLESFLKSRGIKPTQLAEESGYSRQHLLRVRMGLMEPTRRCMAAIVVDCRRLSRERVRASDLFDLGDK